jgi:hypothetical protein
VMRSIRRPTAFSPGIRPGSKQPFIATTLVKQMIL